MESYFLLNGLLFITTIINFNAQIVSIWQVEAPLSWFLRPFDMCLSFLSTCLLSDTDSPDSSCTFSAWALESAAPPGPLAPFSGEWYLELEIWMPLECQSF